jgi:hypothetical protein
VQIYKYGTGDKVQEGAKKENTTSDIEAGLKTSYHVVDYR